MKSDALSYTAVTATAAWRGEVLDAASPCAPPESVSLHARLHRVFWHALIRAFMFVHITLVTVLRRVGRRPRPLRAGEQCKVLLTGTFCSENWIAAQLRPLAGASRCAQVFVASTFPVPPIPKTVAIYPPAWLRWLIGDVAARLVVFAWTALRTRPHFVGGFHLLLNGLTAAFVAPPIGARSMYICTGGPAELLDGGIWAENRLFGKLEAPDCVVERRLARAAREFDLLVVRGERARRFFRKAGVCAPIHVLSGGVDARRFLPTRDAPAFDLILVGRLVVVKRVDVFLRAVQRVVREIPAVSACVLGEGPLREQLEDLAIELGVAHCARFVGQQNDVERWLRRARIFVLTSDTEGLALSLIEAMLCGLPAIVSDVGDLGQLVVNGVNGYRVRRGCPEAFAARIVDLLTDPARCQAFGQAARKAALRYDIPQTARRWDAILGH